MQKFYDDARIMWKFSTFRHVSGSDQKEIRRNDACEENRLASEFKLDGLENINESR
jgi:hypothetical protein